MENVSAVMIWKEDFFVDIKISNFFLTHSNAILFIGLPWTGFEKKIDLNVKFQSRNNNIM